MHLKIEFNVERTFGDPLVKIQIDDYQLMHDGPCPALFEADVNVTIGEHKLIIVHYGKKLDDHSYDENGNMVLDKHAEITNIELDGIPLQGPELWSGVFWPVYDFEKDNQPVTISPNLYLGHNGSWQMIFQYPAAEWLIATRNNGPDLTDTVFKTSDDVFEEAKLFFSAEDLPEI